MLRSSWHQNFRFGWTAEILRLIEKVSFAQPRVGCSGPRAVTQQCFYPINQWDSRTPGIGSAVRAETAGIAAPIANHTSRATGIAARQRRCA
jgi:hypothetical protein